MKMLNTNKAWINFMVCMLTLTALTFNACKEEEDGIRIPDEDEVLTENIILEQTPTWWVVIDHEMWGKRGTLKDTPILIKVGGIDCDFIFLEKEQQPYIRRSHYQRFLIPESKEEEIINYCINKDTITISGDYKYVYTKTQCDAPYSIDSETDYFELNLKEIKKYE